MFTGVETLLTMSKSLMNLDHQSFRSEVLEGDLPAVVEFGGAWCPPCRALEPILERLAMKHVGQWKVGTVDMDEHPALAARYKVRAVPTIIVLRRGEEVARHVGLTSYEKLAALLARA